MSPFEVDAWLELIPDAPYNSKPLKRSLDPNSMKKHGVEVRRQWEHVSRKLERDEAKEETTSNGSNINGSRQRKAGSKSRKSNENNYEQLTDDLLARMEKC